MGDEKERFTQLSLDKSIARASELPSGLRLSDSEFDGCIEARQNNFDNHSVSHAIEQEFAEPPPLCPVPMLGRQCAMDEKRTVIEVAEIKACEFNSELFAVPAEPEKNTIRKELAL